MEEGGKLGLRHGKVERIIGLTFQNPEFQFWLLVNGSNYEDPEIVPYVQANKLTSWLQGCWEKTRDAWVRDKGQYFTHSNT